MMRVWGVWLIFVGVIWLVIAFNMDTSVVSYSGMYGADRVENIGLIARRQNHLMVASLITLIGTLMTIFGGKKEEELELSAFASKPPQPNNPPCERDLSLDPYRLWLAAKYNIIKNDVFDAFVFENQTFNTLEEALQKAHDMEQREYERLKTEAATKAEAEQQKAEALAAQQKQQNKNVKVAGLVLLVCLVIAAPFIHSKIQSELKRAAEYAKEKSIQRQKLQSTWGIIPDKNWIVDDFVAVNENMKDKIVWCDDKKGLFTTVETGLDPNQLITKLSTDLGDGKDPYESATLTTENQQRIYKLKNGNLLHAYATVNGTLFLCETKK